MNLWRIITASIFIIFIISVLTNAQTWTNNGPYGGIISTMAVDPLDTNVVYAGTWYAGIYRSTNGGDYWEAVNNGIPIITDSTSGSTWWYGDYHRISATKFSPSNANRLYAGTAGSGVIQSFDHGDNWTSTNNGLPDSAVVSALWLHPQDSTFLLCGTAYPAGGLYRSTDAGFNWARIDSVPHGNTYSITTIENHPANPDTIYVGVTSAGEPGFAWGLMRTPDGGNTWDILNEMLTFNEITIDPNNPLKMWSWVENNFFMSLFFYSNDGGYNWNPYPSTTNFWDDILGLYADPDYNLYVFDDENESLLLRKSTDHGQTWTSQSVPLISSATMAANPLNTQVIYFGVADAPYRSNDGGQSFQIKETNIINTYIYEVDVNSKNTDILYSGGLWGFWKSTDGGNSWMRFLSLPIFSLSSDPQYPDTVYYFYTAGQFKLMRSFDGGETGVVVLQGYLVNDIEVHPDSSNIIFAASTLSIHKSINWGNNWTITYSGSSEISDIEIHPRNKQILFFGSGNGLYKSTDGGDSWNQISNPGNVISIALHPTNLDSMFIATGSKIMLSENGGASFTEISQDIPSQRMSKVVLDTLNPSHIYVGTKDKGMFYSLNAGQSWQRLNGDYNVRVRDIDLVPHEDRMFVGTNGFGVWHGDDILVNIQNNNNGPVISRKLQLLPAYPNPFNGQIAIPFYVPARSRLKLSIYNVRGQKVKYISDKVFSAGYHQTQWDGTSNSNHAAASGIYFIRLSDNNHSEIRKILLIR